MFAGRNLEETGAGIIAGFLVGDKFRHLFWRTNIHEDQTVECEIMEITHKQVKYRSLAPNDTRVGRCKPAEFHRQIARVKS